MRNSREAIATRMSIQELNQAVAVAADLANFGYRFIPCAYYGPRTRCWSVFAGVRAAGYR